MEPLRPGSGTHFPAVELGQVVPLVSLSFPNYNMELIRLSMGQRWDNLSKHLALCLSWSDHPIGAGHYLFSQGHRWKLRLRNQEKSGHWDDTVSSCFRSVMLSPASLHTIFQSPSPFALPDTFFLGGLLLSCGESSARRRQLPLLYHHPWPLPSTLDSSI